MTGRSTFIDNLDIPGALHVVYARSTVAHGRILSIDTSEAAAMPVSSPC